MEQAQALLDAEAIRLSGLDPQLVIVTTRRTGETPAVLKQLSDTAETVVVGSDRAPDSHGEGFGAVSFQTAVTSRCPVAVIPAGGGGEYSAVVVGVDGSDDSTVALKLAGAEALRAGKDLIIVHAAPAPGSAVSPVQLEPGSRGPAADGQLLLSAAAHEVNELYPDLDVRQVLEADDSPASALVRAAAHAALLVIGCRGGGSARKPIGLVAAHVLEQLPCPTIVTRPAAQSEGRLPSTASGAASGDGFR
jgi:nucleotide-binding universal stress UspA family protein